MSKLGLGETARTVTTTFCRRANTQAVRVIAITLLAVGGTVAACSANGITGPSDGGGMSPSASANHDLLGTGVITSIASVKTEEDPAVSQANPDFATSTETTFPVTEAVTNTCYNNETPILNGFLKQREKIAMDDLTFKYKLQTWKDTRGVFATATTYYDDDHDPATPPRQMLVRYRNRTNTLDKFEVGPAGLPFSSDQESVMFLERLSPEHGMKYGPYDDREDDDDDREYRHGAGDDLFVYARQAVTVDKNGVQREKNVFRTECR
jgi:lipoprotein-anchoring transpeptidase ErfK/SrfK